MLKVKFKAVLLGICLVAVAAAGLILVKVLLPSLEGVAPEIHSDRIPAAIGQESELHLRVTDAGTGLRKVWVAVMQAGREIVLADERYETDPATGDVDLVLRLDPKKNGLGDGRAMLRIAARDRSWRRWWNGNPAYLEKEILIDTMAPRVTVLTRMHNIAQGGSGMVIYRLSEACPQSGVQIGDAFYPGYSGYFQERLVYMATVALEHDQGRDVPAFVTAVDRAGNTGRSGFPHHFRKKSFRSDNIPITDSFLQTKMPEFDVVVPSNAENPDLAKFLLVNRDQRAADYQKIVQAVRTSENVLYWDGAFLRLPNSARRAGFADRRAYLYRGKNIDRQVHMGIDLASLAHSPVPAANRGKVIFADRLGIYGNTIILDHGFGLFSMYAHLSSMGVPLGQIVSRGETIGMTGTTGMAAGDHLHFSMLAGATFVDPVEWWDGAWIQNNILSKIESVRAIFQQ